MRARVIFGLLAAVSLTALVFVAPEWSIELVVLICAVIGVREYEALFYNDITPSNRRFRMTVLVCAAVIALDKDVSLGWIFLWLPFVLLGVRYVFRSNESGEFELSVRDFAFEFLGIFYVVSIFGFLTPISHQNFGREYLCLLFFIVFSGDTAAYFVGTYFGRAKLASRLSPGKSIEGAAAAIVTAMAFTWLWQQFIYTGPKWGLFMFKITVTAVSISALAQMSDLFESLLKRSVARKDSGAFLPGHGGILDRLDGLALAAPAFYFIIVYFLE